MAKATPTPDSDIEAADTREVTVNGVKLTIPATIDEWPYAATRAFSAAVQQNLSPVSVINIEEFFAQLVGVEKARELIRTFVKASDASEAAQALVAAYGDSGE